MDRRTNWYVSGGGSREDPTVFEIVRGDDNKIRVVSEEDLPSLINKINWHIYRVVEALGLVVLAEPSWFCDREAAEEFTLSDEQTLELNGCIREKQQAGLPSEGD